jgi:hypothetical protein
LFRARISTGTVDAILARASDALEDPYEDLLRRVRRAKALNMDEIGWRRRRHSPRPGPPPRIAHSRPRLEPRDLALLARPHPI